MIIEDWLEEEDLDKEGNDELYKIEVYNEKYFNLHVIGICAHCKFWKPGTSPYNSSSCNLVIREGVWVGTDGCKLWEKKNG